MLSCSVNLEKLLESHMYTYDLIFLSCHLRSKGRGSSSVYTGLSGTIKCNHFSKGLPCHSSTVFTWLYSFSRLYPLGNNIIESSLVNQGWRSASSALIREAGGYTRNCCRRFKIKFVGSS